MFRDRRGARRDRPQKPPRARAGLRHAGLQPVYDLVLLAGAIGTVVLVFSALELPVDTLAQSRASSPTTPESPVRVDATPRPTPPRAARADAAALAYVDGSAWRWLGPSTCRPGVSEVTEIDRSTDGGLRWTAVTAPLAGVRRISFATETAGVAVGYDASCLPTAATTTDGGVSWRTFGTSEPLAVADLAPNRLVWAVGRVGASAPVLRGTDPSAFEAVANGCAQAATGAPSLISAGTAPELAWLLCQNGDGSGRLLLQSNDAGTTWRQLAGRRAATGFAGGGKVRDFDFPTNSAGWSLLDGAGCPEGQIRVSTAGGGTWSTLPCPLGSVLGSRVLAVAFSDAQRGVLVASMQGGISVLRTTNGGRSWLAASA